MMAIINHSVNTSKVECDVQLTECKLMVDKVSIVNLSTLTTDTTSQLDVLWHDGDTLGMDSAQVGIFEETNEV